MDAYYLRYTITLEEPVLIGNGSQMGNILTTCDYIPGSTLLGLCAGLFLRKFPSAESETDPHHMNFQDLFLSDKTCFKNGYPLTDNLDKTFPMPFSVFGCKDYGYQKPKIDLKPMHGINDYLFKKVPDICPDANCSAAMVHKSGYAYLNPDFGLCNYDADRQIITHNQVSDKKEESRLFSFEVLSRGQQFSGEIVFSETSHREIIKNLFREGPFRIGKARNRGYGGITITYEESDEPIQKSLSEGSPNGDSEISLYFLSDAILMDSSLNYAGALKPRHLTDALGIDGETKIVVITSPDSSGNPKSFWKHTPVMGFNAKRKMPLPMERAISKGSVFTVKILSNTAAAFPDLSKLHQRGIGLRRNEGYGQMVVNHKIHGLQP